MPVVEAWLADTTRVSPSCTWRRLEGGHSNLTYLLTDSTGEQYVIRRPPQGELLPEGARHAPRVPDHRRAASGRCARRRADRVLRRPRRVRPPLLRDGQGTWRGPVHRRADGPRLDAAARARVGESFIAVLARLHAIDAGRCRARRPRATRRIRRATAATWYGSWTASAEAAAYDDDRLHALHARLVAEIPEQGPARVVHGDYGVHNVMIDDSGEVVAVLDWEIGTLGDPLADFAYALNAWTEPTDGPEAASVAADGAHRLRHARRSSKSTPPGRVPTSRASGTTGASTRSRRRASCTACTPGIASG